MLERSGNPVYGADVSFIEWKKVLLIAGMLPLRAALDKSGTAPLLAEDVVGTLEGFGPYAVLFGLLVLFN